MDRNIADILYQVENKLNTKKDRSSWKQTKGKYNLQHCFNWNEYNLEDI